MAQCCPVNNVFIDANGNFHDIGFGTGSVINFTPLFANKCTRPTFTATGYLASAPTFDPIDCPCCPVGFEWSSYKGVCMNLAGAVAATVPCIKCVCPDPIPFTCDCGTDGQPISFGLSTHTKNCVDCEPEAPVEPNGRLRCFMPSQYINPTIINFKLKNKNFI